MEESVALRRPPIESVEFLLREAFREQEELFKSKDSIDTRASFLLGLLGVILTVFVGVFVGYWPASATNQLAISDNFAWWLSLLLTLGVIVSLLGAVVLEIWVLLPRIFGIGLELPDAYEQASNPKYDLGKMEEGTLRALIPFLITNQMNYERAAMVYQMGAMVTIGALSFAIEFVVLLMGTSIKMDARSGILAWGMLSLIGLLIIGLVLLVTIKKARSYLANKAALEEQLRQYRNFLTRLKSSGRQV